MNFKRYTLRHHGRLAWCILLWWLLSIPAYSNLESSEARSATRLETPAEQTKKALEQIVFLDLDHHPLSEVIRLLKDQSGVRIVLDRQGLSQIGINPDDTIVSTQLTMKLGSCLRQILSQHNLDYAIIGDMVFITTEDLAVRRQMQQPISVRFDGLQLTAALDQLARETATNLVLDNLAHSFANSPVTLTVDEAPLEVITKLLAHQVGLTQTRVGNVLMVTTKDNAVELRDDFESPRPMNFPILNRQITEDFLVNPPLFVPAVPAFAPAPAPAAAPAPAPVVVPPAPPQAPPDKKEEKKEDK